MLITLDRLDHEEDIWGEFCITNVDVASYAGVALNELIFWSNDDGEIDEVELPAFRVSLMREKYDVRVSAADNNDARVNLLMQDW